MSGYIEINGYQQGKEVSDCRYVGYSEEGLSTTSRICITSIIDPTKTSVIGKSSRCPGLNQIPKLNDSKRRQQSEKMLKRQNSSDNKSSILKPCNQNANESEPIHKRDLMPTQDIKQMSLGEGPSEDICPMGITNSCSQDDIELGTFEINPLQYEHKTGDITTDPAENGHDRLTYDGDENSDEEGEIEFDDIIIANTQPDGSNCKKTKCWIMHSKSEVYLCDNGKGLSAHEATKNCVFHQKQYVGIDDKETSGSFSLKTVSSFKSQVGNGANGFVITTENGKVSMKVLKDTPLSAKRIKDSDPRYFILHKVKTHYTLRSLAYPGMLLACQRKGKVVRVFMKAVKDCDDTMLVNDGDVLFKIKYMDEDASDQIPTHSRRVTPV